LSNNLCLDASALVPFLIGTPTGPAAARKIESALRLGATLYAPNLVYGETTSVLRRYIHAGQLLPEQARQALAAMIAVPISVCHEQHIYQRALDLAALFRRSKPYDSLYLAATERTGSQLVTADQGLHNSALSLGLNSHLLAPDS